MAEIDTYWIKRSKYRLITYFVCNLLFLTLTVIATWLLALYVWERESKELVVLFFPAFLLIFSFFLLFSTVRKVIQLCRSKWIFLVTDKYLIDLDNNRIFYLSNIEDIAGSVFLPYPSRYLRFWRNIRILYKGKPMELSDLKSLRKGNIKNVNHLIDNAKNENKARNANCHNAQKSKYYQLELCESSTDLVDLIPQIQSSVISK